MKAVRYHSYGASGVLVYEDAGRPVAVRGSYGATARVCAYIRVTRI
jgi:hypothetical protein